MQWAIKVAERQEEMDVEMVSQPKASGSAAVCLFSFLIPYFGLVLTF